MSVDLEQGDCLELMKHLPKHSVDMILCDLPYGLTNNEMDKVIPFEKIWEQYSRVMKTNGAILLFAQGTFFVDLINSNRKEYRYDIIWDKCLITGFLNSRKMPLRRHEQIAVFYKKLPTYNPQMSEGAPLHSKGSKIKTGERVNHNYGYFHATDDERAGSTQKYPTSIIQISKPHPSVCVHPNQKPVLLLEYLIRTYTNENEMVLDNCMGSGTTGVACVKTNRNFIGYELDPTYFEIAKNRIRRAELDKLLEGGGDAE